MAEVTITRTARVPGTNGARVGKFDLLVFYRREDGGSGFVMVPDESATEDTIKAAIRSDLDRHAKLAGKKLAL